ncbi:1,4-alpha-glucan branching enzyme GlgB [bioreactor metagenome]|uniref:1,4-alpha-glucan branching enzyme GlgB n=1 Tax=bioreactor metagenome TaxID=1076179 RepID=A0A644ZQT6_9ZZZZ
MGAEFGQEAEWNFEQSLDWHLLEQEPHRQLQTFFQTAGAFYLEHKELWEEDFDWKGFQWLCSDDKNGNTAAFLRKDTAGNPLVVVCNFSPVHRKGYRIGLPFAGQYKELLNTDDPIFGGDGYLNPGPLLSQPIPCHGVDQSMEIDLPPLAAVIFRCTRKYPAKNEKTKHQNDNTRNETEAGGSVTPAEKIQR